MDGVIELCIIMGIGTIILGLLCLTMYRDVLWAKTECNRLLDAMEDDGENKPKGK